MSMDSKTFARVHKATTGFSLKNEQLSGEVLNKSKAELLAECIAHDSKNQTT